MKFKKNPIIIEAHRLGDDGWPDSIWQGVIDNKIILDLHTNALKECVGHAFIETLEGTMRAEIGDWIIKGIEGEFYSCKDSIFKKTYTPLSEYLQLDMALNRLLWNVGELVGRNQEIGETDPLPWKLTSQLLCDILTSYNEVKKEIQQYQENELAEFFDERDARFILK